jgi:branched-chain amino acid transport system ATP-binding protein
MLELRNIVSGYGKKKILSGISFVVNKGEITLLVGGNGSGKSTILKCIYNTLELWEGEIFFENKRIDTLKPHELIKKGIVYIPQKDNVFQNLTIRENLEVSGSIYPKEEIKQKIQEVFNTIPSLEDYQNKTPFNLSGGEKQLLSFGIALMHNPRLILFDEPLAGLTGKNAEVILNNIKTLNNQGVTFLIVEHRIKELEFIDKQIKLYLGRIKK